MRHLLRRPPGGEQHWQAAQAAGQQCTALAMPRLGIQLPAGRPASSDLMAQVDRAPTARPNSLSMLLATRGCLLCLSHCTGLLEPPHETDECARASCCRQAALSAQTLLAGAVHRVSAAQGFSLLLDQLRLSSVVIISPGWLPSTARPPQRQTEAQGTTGA